MATFSDFYNQRMSAAPQQTSSAVPKYDFSWMPKPGQSVNEPEPQSPLNWAVDMISRPLFAATSTVTGISEAAARTKEGKSLGEVLGALAENNPLVGLLSTDPEQKRTYSDVIEQQTDRHGPLDDPNYVDIEDNVDPVLRGIVGFGLDVVADPLTWIPGGIIAKGVKGIGQGAKTAVEAGTNLVKKGGKIEDVAETAVKAADDAPIAPAARVVDEAENPFAPGASVASEVPVPRAPAAEVIAPAVAKVDDVPTTSSVGAAAKVEKSSAKTAKKLEDEYTAWSKSFRGAAPKAEQITSLLNSVQKVVGTTQKVSKPAAKVVDDGQAIKLSQYESALGHGPIRETDEYLSLSQPLQEALVTKTGAGDPVSYHRLMSIAKSNSPVNEAVRKEARTFLRSEYFATKQAADVVEKTAVDDLATAFVLRKGQERSRFNKVLGESLATQLERKSSKRLEQLIPKIVEVLSPNAADDVVQRFFEGQSMKQLGQGVTDALGIRPYVKPTANTAEEVAEVRARLPELRTDADIAVVKTLRVDVTDAKQTYPVAEGNVRFTELDKQARIGRHVTQLNTQHQYTLWRNLSEAIQNRMGAIKGVPADQLAGARRAQAYRQAFYEAGDSAADTYSALGLKLHLGTGHAEDLIPMNMFEAFRTVERGFDSEQVALSALFNYGSAIAPTRFMEGVFTALNSAGRNADEVLESVRAVLRNQKLPGYRGQVLDKNLPNNALKGGGKLGHFAGKNAKAQAETFAKKIPGAQVARNGNKGYFVVTGSEGMIEPIAQAIVKSLPELQARVADNVANYAARGIDEASSLSNAAIKELKSILETGDQADVLTALAKIRQSVTKPAEDIGAFPSSVASAEAIVETAAGETAVKIGKSMKTAEGKVNAGGDRAPAVATANQKVSDDLTDEMAELVSQEIDDPLTKMVKAEIDESVPAIDLASMHADPVVAQNAFFGTKLGSALKTAFDQSYGMGHWWDVMHSKKTNASEFLASQAGKLRELRKLPEEAQVAAWNALRAGVPNSNAEVQAGTELIQDIIRPLFGTADNADRTLLNNVFLSTESDIGHINDILKQKFGRDTSFQLDDAIDGWKSWEFSNPSEDLYKLSDSAATVVEHRAIVGSFTSTMKKAGLLSTEPKPGFVRIENTGGSTFARLIPEGTYVDRQMANELHRLDILTRTDRNLSGELGDFLRKSFIPSQNIWKQLVTVYRPGHHVRNTMGNSFMSWIDRGNRYWMSSQKDAFKVLGVKNNYTDLDLVDALKSFTDDVMPTGGEVIVNGRFGPITSREMFEIFERNGLRSTYASSEDLMADAATGILARAGDRLTSSVPGRVAGNVSHVIDHHGKLSHLIQILKQEAEGGRYAKFGKNLSKEQVIREAVKQVKRAHPDSMMLTPFESKYRFLIPFYTWFAKTAPFAMESAMRNPGRIATIPKASYELAVAMGVNPDSLVDPFPEDQLFPSYLTENAFGPQLVGPDGEYININPGVPQFDMAKSMLDPLSMVSPFLKVPAELATQSRVGGGKINDMSDYLDQNLPLVNYLANMTGTSVTGSAVSLLQGQGLDPQAQVAKGSKGPLDQGLTFSNWFSGLNAQNWSRPSYINSAEIEKRNRMSGNGRGGF